MKRLKILFFLTLLCVISFSGALLFEQSRVEDEVRTYLSSWEEDMARSLLAQKDSAPLEKILTHVLRLGVRLRKIESQVHQDQFKKFLSNESLCRADFSIPVGLYGLPAASLQFCQPFPNLVVRTLVSPILFGVLIMGFLLIWYFSRENWKIEIEKSKLQSRVDMQEELARVSRQVAHDIRGPLSALQLLVGLSHDAEDEKTKLLKNASNRIRAIADDLFSRGKMSLQGTCPVQALQISLKQLVGEFHLQFPKQTIEIHFVEKLKGELPLRNEVWQRILQNLIKNSIEANLQKSETGVVRCEVFGEHKSLIISLVDQGSGIPKEIIEQLGQEGISFGKKDGTGLGLFSAKRYLAAVGGKVEIYSIKSGTEVRITCPLQSQNPVPFQGTA